MRTHGLIHNKADLVPWVLMLLAASPPGQQAEHIKLLLGAAYASSGLLKLRLSGPRWARGSNLRRLTAQFVLELGQAEAGEPRNARPTWLQRGLLCSPWLCALLQPAALAFECAFLVVVFLGPP